MTRRARWTRPLSAFFALWFAFVLGDPGLLHACPMHGGHGVASAAADAGAEHHAAHGEHGSAGSTASHGASHNATHDASHHGKTGPCTCVGQCCVAPAVAPLPTVAALHLPATVARVEPASLVAFVVAPTAPDVRLPFANGPPTA